MSPTPRTGVLANTGKLLLLAGIAGLILLCYQLGILQLLNLEYLIDKRTSLTDYYHTRPYTTVLIFFASYVTLTGLSLPAAGIMIVASGVIFGLLWGTIISLVAHSTGSTIAFLCSRYLLRDMVHARFSENLGIVNREFEADGLYYLFLLRQISIFPSFLINILMGLTPVSTTGFYLVTLIGMLPVTVVFVNAGTQIATINALSDILSIRLVGALILAGIMPLLIKKIALLIKNPNLHKNAN